MVKGRKVGIGSLSVKIEYKIQNTEDKIQGTEYKNTRYKYNFFFERKVFIP